MSNGLGINNGLTKYSASMGSWLPKVNPIIDTGLNSSGPAVTGPASFNWQTKLFGDKENTGWLNGGLAALSSGVNSWMALKQTKLAKEMFRSQKAFAETDLANQAKTINEQLETRQNRRMQEGTATMSTPEFMQKYGVSGKVGG